MSHALPQLDHRLGLVRESGRFEPAVLDAFTRWIGEAEERELFRANPFHYAQAQGLTPKQAIDLFIHAARAGVFDFSWGIVCPYCAAFISSGGGLRQLRMGRTCGLCLVTVDGPIDDAVEVTFTLSPAIRPLRFHGNWRALQASALDPELLRRDAQRLYFSSASIDGSEVRKLFEENFILGEVVRREEQVEIKTALPKRKAWRLFAPAVHAVLKLRPVEGAPRSATVECHDGRFVPEQLDVPPDALDLRVINRTNHDEMLIGLIGLDFIPGEEMRPGEQGDEDDDGESTDAGDAPELPPFLTGRRLLSTQSFRELFRAETLDEAASLEIRSMALLFTDLKASTQLYERVGDLKALALVREHFRRLYEAIDRHEGAVVKTIGDAVMATFIDPKAAVEAAIEMVKAMEGLVGHEELSIKVGIHVGPVVAIDSNERLDYFGQTVNVAARVQGLAEGDELVVTDDVWLTPGVRKAFRGAGLEPHSEQVRLKGIDAPVGVRRVQVAR